ncbi:unnamed protein product [Merluccius merluccius]
MPGPIPGLLPQTTALLRTLSGLLRTNGLRMSALLSPRQAKMPQRLVLPLGFLSMFLSYAQFPFKPRPPASPWLPSRAAMPMQASPAPPARDAVLM